MSVVTPIVAYATSLDAADQAAFAPMAGNPSLIQWFENAFNGGIGASSAQAGEQLIPGLFNPLPQGVTQAQATAIVDAATGCVASTQVIFSILNDNQLHNLVTIGVLNQSPYTLQYVTPTPLLYQDHGESLYFSPTIAQGQVGWFGFMSASLIDAYGAEGAFGLPVLQAPDTWTVNIGYQCPVSGNNENNAQAGGFNMNSISSLEAFYNNSVATGDGGTSGTLSVQGPSGTTYTLTIGLNTQDSNAGFVGILATFSTAPPAS